MRENTDQNNSEYGHFLRSANKSNKNSNYHQLISIETSNFLLRMTEKLFLRTVITISRANGIWVPQQFIRVSFLTNNNWIPHFLITNTINFTVSCMTLNKIWIVSCQCLIICSRIYNIIFDIAADGRYSICEGLSSLYNDQNNDQNTNSLFLVVSKPRNNKLIWSLVWRCWRLIFT